MSDGPDRPDEIPGWFDFADFYQAQIDRVSDGAAIVECGTYLGRSTACLAAAIQRSGKQIACDTIDTFLGVPEAQWLGTPPADRFTFADQEALRVDGTLEAAARAHLAPYGDTVRIRCADAIAAAADYADGSLDFVFLDDDHTTDHVLREVRAWWPKIKPGGVLAGHDYDWAPVGRALTVWSLQVGRAIDQVSARSWACVKPTRRSWITPPATRRALVAVCCNERNVPRRTVDSLVRLGWGSRLTDAAARHGFRTVDFFWSDQRLLVSDLRDEAVMAGLAGDYSHLIFLDADMVWPMDVLDRLLRHHGRGIVSGLYHLKTWPHWPVAMKHATWNPTDQDFDYTYDAEAPHTELLRPEQLVGMGCAIVPLEVCRRFERPWFAYQQTSSGLTTITEDVWFCQHAAAVECPIWLDPTIECRHISQELIATPHFDRATYEMHLLATGSRLVKADVVDDPAPVPA
jgi:predicted O-methyltransferase YrrM